MCGSPVPVPVLVVERGETRVRARPPLRIFDRPPPPSPPFPRPRPKATLAWLPVARLQGGWWPVAATGGALTFSIGLHARGTDDAVGHRCA